MIDGIDFTSDQVCPQSHLQEEDNRTGYDLRPLLLSTNKSSHQHLGGH